MSPLETATILLPLGGAVFGFALFLDAFLDLHSDFRIRPVRDSVSLGALGLAGLGASALLAFGLWG